MIEGNVRDGRDALDVRARRPYRLHRRGHGDRIHREHAAGRIVRTVIAPPEPIRPRTERRSARPIDAGSDPRLRRVVAHLVRTMRSCPAPGVAPLTLRDWLLLGSVVVVPYLLLVAAVALSGRG